MEGMSHATTSFGRVPPTRRPLRSDRDRARRMEESSLTSAPDAEEVAALVIDNG